MSSASAAEEEIADAEVEWLIVVDPTGRQKARFRGTDEEVDSSDRLKQRSAGLYGESVLKDHQIIHNHPPAVEGDAVVSFPPSMRDLTMAVERDLASLVVVSGPRRYEVRRPHPTWPADEGLLAEIVDATVARLSLELGPADGSLAATISLQRAVLECLHRDGWIDYDETERPSRLR